MSSGLLGMLSAVYRDSVNRALADVPTDGQTDANMLWGCGAVGLWGCRIARYYTLVHLRAALLYFLASKYINATEYSWEGTCARKTLLALIASSRS
jgi:hypothetical protein